jgi:hypothetical protein
MSSLKEELQWPPTEVVPHPLSDAARRLAAGLLVAASESLARIASALAPIEKPAPTDPRFEFHAEAGAPEGALYVDGEFVGHLRGVSRL